MNRRSVIEVTNLPVRAQTLLEAIIHTLDDKKAVNPVVINLHGKSDIADYMIVASGTSTTHVGTLAKHIEAAFKDADIQVLSVEGLGNNQWVLVDTASIIVHIFHPDTREIYKIEQMWDEEFPNADAEEVIILH